VTTSNHYRRRDKEIARKAKADAKRQRRLERRQAKKAGGSNEQAR
jgi:hypothetical protein